MPKLGMKPVRRGQLIGATIATIGELGFADASVIKIAKRAGVSPGIVHHYFADKNALLEAAMRDLLAQLSRSVIQRLQKATTPLERIDAVIDGNFTTDQFHTTTVAAWLAFWAQAIHNPALRRLRDINVARLRSNLRYDLKTLVPAKAASEAAFGLAALIDGLWLNAALSNEAIDANHLSQTAKAHARNLFDPNRNENHHAQTV
jgi:TetR/AcrR family transcriptional regulator, transcriptional repressor of bet genes